MKENGAIKTKSVEKAFLEVERHAFFPDELVSQAYEDNAFPIGFGQTISQPSTIATMLEMLNAKKGMRVLEVGSGTGYVSALLSNIVGPKGKVFGIDILPELVERAKLTLQSIGLKNVELKQGDGGIGWKEKSPFERILVSAACASVPEALFEEINENGILVAPVGIDYADLVLFEKKNGKVFERERQGWFAFVPLQTPEQEVNEWKGVT